MLLYVTLLLLYVTAHAIFVLWKIRYGHILEEIEV